MSTKRRICRAVATLLVASFVLAGLSSPAAAATPAQIEQAIVDGLAWLAGQQNPDGSWGSGCDIVGHTGLPCLKFEHRAYELGFDDPTDGGYQYGQVVSDCLDYIVSQAQTFSIASEPDADLYPSPGGNGLGVAFNGCHGSGDVYVTGIAMMALAAGATANPTVIDPLLADARDWMSFAQINPTGGVHRGGWRYLANYSDSDNSVGGYAALGLGYAAAPPPCGTPGLTIPPFVLAELSLWIGALQDASGGTDDGGSHYTPGGGWVNILKTGNLLYEMCLVGDTAASLRVQRAINYIERHWNDGVDIGWQDYRQATFCLVKGLEGCNIDRIDVKKDGSMDDWFDLVSDHLVATQNADGSWPIDPWGPQVLSTTWGLLALERAVCKPPPIIPTVTEWGLIILTLIGLAAGTIAFARRRTARTAMA